MGYLISQIWICLLLAAIIGGIIGWVFRGGCRSKIEAVETNYRRRLADMEAEQSKLTIKVDDYDAVTRERDTLSAQVSGLQAVEQERDDLSARLTALERASTAAAVSSKTEGIITAESEAAKDDIDIESSGSDSQSSYDIEEIEGIGAGYGKRLRGISINTTTDLLENCSNMAAVESVAGKIDMPPDVVRSWTSMADLMRVNGVGGQYAELLEFSNVHSVSTLADSDTEGLTLKMKDVNARENRVKEVPQTLIVTGWIKHAGTLSAKLDDDLIHAVSGGSRSPTDTLTISQADFEAAADMQSSYEIEEIEGIGKGYGKKLRELGIATTADMLNKCPDEASMAPIIEAMNLEDWVIRSWATMADLMRVNGIGGQYAELLNFSDIQNVQDLANANSPGLVAKMNTVNAKEHRVKEVPNIDTVTGWIEHAKTLPGMLRLGAI